MAHLLPRRTFIKSAQAYGSRYGVAGGIHAFSDPRQILDTGYCRSLDKSIRQTFNRIAFVISLHRESRWL